MAKAMSITGRQFFRINIAVKMCSRSVFLTVLLSLSYLSKTCSQEFTYKHYDVQNGLANSTIHSIFQDKEGFLWIGTESGLCRYDGTRFRTFTVKDGLAGNDVFGMFQDSKERIWLQQYKSTVSYIYKGKVFNQENDTLLKKIRLTNRLHGIAEDGDGNIALCDNETVYIIMNGSNAIRAINSIDGKPIKAIGLYTDSDGKLVVTTGHSVYKIENYRLKQIKKLTNSDAPIGPNNIIWHPCYTMNNYYDSLFLRDTSIHIRSPNRHIIKYSSLSDSVFSINTEDGAHLYNINNRNFVNVLPGVKVTNTFIDRERNLWIGTMSNGIYKIGSQAIINKKISPNQNDIFYITKEKDEIVVGNNNSEIYAYAKNEFVNRNAPVGNGSYLYKTFHHEKLPGGMYFMAHAMGLMNYENGVIKNTLHSIMLKQIRSLDTDHVLLSGHLGVFVVQKKGCRIVDTIWRRRSLCSFKTNDSILIGTTYGLFVIKRTKDRYIVADSLLPSSMIWDIKRSADNLLWVCTSDNGLYCIKDGKVLRHFADTSGLSGNNGRSMHIDGNNVWLGTDKGLVKITRKGNDFHLQKFSTSDGLPSDQINAIYVDSSIVYLGTPEGLCHFDERKIETTSICNLILTGVRIDDKQVDLSDNYYLRRNQQLAIEFSGISFRSEQEMTYRYRINGVDDNWRNTKLNSLEFPSLPYGDYELEIVAINKFGKESLPLIISFHSPRPFYRTAWFIVLMVIVAVGVILFLYNRRLNLVRQKQMKKIQQEIKIMELEQMALRAQMNPHFIFNCLSVMQQLVAENDTSNAQKFIGSFSNLVRQTLNNAAELFIPLKEEIKFLTNYFELERIRLEDRFSYTISISGKTKENELCVPNMIIQPFVENAIRHGIRYKKNGKGLIEVCFDVQDTFLRCTVTDNGIGREKAAQMRKEAGVLHDSKGMDITFNRIESLNALTGMNISIVVEDMKDEKQAPSGTKAIIEFYKTQNYYDKNSNN
jgi:ligand-binding sensor domain-containing protein